jgi:transposase InsO family protein
MTDRTIAQRFRSGHVRVFLSSGLSERAYSRLPDTPSRKILRKYLKAFRAAGEDGLQSRPQRRCPANRTGLGDEAHILTYVKENSGHGPQRIANELRGQIGVGHNGVHGVLVRHGINRRKARQDWARRELGEIVTLDEIETARQKAKHRHVQAPYPGHTWGQDTFLVGRLKGIGKVYHYLAVDLASSFGVARLYNARNADNACDFLQHHLVAKAKNMGIHCCLQDNGTEFTSARWRRQDGSSNHPFESLAARLGIELRFIQPRHAWTNGSCERLHQTLLHEFYIPALCRKIYTSIEELDYDLQLFMGWYNFRRTHQGFRLRGRTPAQVYLGGTTPKEGFFFNVA